MLVIPRNPEQTYTWKAQLFVTPSKIIIQSVIALLGKSTYMLDMKFLNHAYKNLNLQE